VRVYRTADGRHVAEGHPDAAFLAYTDHDELPESVLAEVKQVEKPANKARKPQANKSAPKKAE